MLSPSHSQLMDSTESAPILDNFQISSSNRHYPQNNIFIKEYSFFSIVSKA